MCSPLTGTGVILDTGSGEVNRLYPRDSPCSSFLYLPRLIMKTEVRQGRNPLIKESQKI